LQAQQMADLDR